MSRGMPVRCVVAAGGDDMIGLVVRGGGGGGDGGGGCLWGVCWMLPVRRSSYGLPAMELDACLFGGESKKEDRAVK